MNSDYDSNSNYYGPSEPVDPFGGNEDPNGNNNGSNGGDGNPYNNYNYNNNNGSNATPEQQKKASNYANASLGLGIYTVASNLVCCGFLNLITGILSIVFAFVSKNAIQSKSFDSKSKAGVICSVIGLAMSVLMYIIFIIVFVFIIMSESGEIPTTV